MSRSELEREIAQSLPAVSRAWRNVADAAVAEFGVSNSIGWCLVYLSRLGPDVRQTDLAQAIGITQPSLVRTLDQLEMRQLVNRAPHPEDRRSNRLSLTTEGTRLVGLVEAKLAGIRAALLQGISDDDLANALRVLGVVASRAVATRG